MIECPRQTILQLLGSIMKYPELLAQTDKYRIFPQYFSRALDRYVFSTIYNLYSNGAKQIHVIDIDTQIQLNPAAKATYDQENGLRFIQDCEEFSEVENFDFYYNQFRKINLLRELQKKGVDISSFYCENPLDKDYEKINQNFENLTCKEIIENLKGELAALENEYAIDTNIERMNAFTGIKELVASLKVKPEMGAPMQGELFNTVSRGARLGKLYLRSASSGVGKTRTMVGDSCKMAFPIRYDRKLGKWVNTGSCEKVLYIATEQDVAEIQTMVLAYLTDINEEAFLYGRFDLVDMQLITKAIDILEKFQDNLQLVRVSDPSASVVKNIIREYHRQFQVNYVFYDYIFSSPAMLTEYRDLGLKEYVVLRLFTTELKDLAVELNIFILTSTQISNDDGHGGFKDYHQIQASKAIVNLCDFACIMSRPSSEEIEELRTNIPGLSYPPNIVLDVFKNRRGRWTQIRIWGHNDLGTCRREEIFVTDIKNNPIEDFTQIDFKIDSDKFTELEDYYNDGVLPSEESEVFVDAFVEIVHESQSAHAEKEDDFFITDAFDNKIDLYKKAKKRSLSSYFD